MDVSGRQLKSEFIKPALPLVEPAWLWESQVYLTFPEVRKKKGAESGQEQATNNMLPISIFHDSVLIHPS